MKIIAGTTLTISTSTPFTNEAGTAADPSTVIFAWQVGSGAVQQQTYGQGGSTIVRDATGSYHLDIDTTAAPGTYTFSVIGIGNGVSVVAEGMQLVAAPTVAATLP